MGVGYLGPLMSGAITLTNVSYAVGGLAASTVISYCAGTIGYAVNETLNGRDYEFNAASNYGKTCRVKVFSGTLMVDQLVVLAM